MIRCLSLFIKNNYLHIYKKSCCPSLSINFYLLIIVKKRQTTCLCLSVFGQNRWSNMSKKRRTMSLSSSLFFIKILIGHLKEKMTDIETLFAVFFKISRYQMECPPILSSSKIAKTSYHRRCCCRRRVAPSPLSLIYPLI